MELGEGVERLIREVSEAEILSRFQRLDRSEIRAKSAGELVTEVDLAVERRLSAGLQSLLPAAIVGEESCAQNPALLRALRSPGRVWVIDPIDGTHHFARGEEPFGVMVALIIDSVTEMGWIYLPRSRCMASARRGEGAFLDGERVRIAGAPPTSPRGALLLRFFPGELRAAVEAKSDGLETIEPERCAAKRYVELVEQREHFALYYRTHVWDHAAGALLATEAGGVARRLDGADYRPGSDDSGLLVASSAALWDRLRDQLF